MIYCTNCKYFTLAVFDDYNAWSDYCNAPTGEMVNDPIYGRYANRPRYTVGSKNYSNQNGKCKYYKRKWYKFWIKGDK